MFDQMKQLMEMKRQAELLKKELEAARIEVKDVRGITLVVNGAQNVQSIALEETWIQSAQKGRLEADLLKAFNAAVKKSQDFAAQKMRSMPGLNIPGM